MLGPSESKDNGKQPGVVVEASALGAQMFVAALWVLDRRSPSVFFVFVSELNCFEWAFGERGSSCHGEHEGFRHGGGSS